MPAMWAKSRALCLRSYSQRGTKDKSDAGKEKIWQNDNID